MHRLAAIITTVAALTWIGTAHAGPHYQVLYNFCALPVSNICTDGAAPAANAIVDKHGNLFGTTKNGGSVDSGTVFTLASPNSGQYRSKIQTLYNFCATNPTRCPEGAQPQGNLILDTDGNLYGTTFGGPYSEGGSVFKLTRQKNPKKTWPITILHTFALDTEGADTDYLTYLGAQTGLYDGKSPLFVVNATGGPHQGGALVKLTRGGGKWNPTILYSFCQETGCSDGQYPNPGLVFDSAGNIYGTTKNGGTNPVGGSTSNGIVFEVTPGASQPETVLHNFCMQQNCSDGAMPASGVVRDASGNLWGVTPQTSTGLAGVLYKLVPQGANSPYQLLPNSCQQNCDFQGAPAFDPSGNLIGTTMAGGKNDNLHAGAIYQYGGGKYTLLYSFCYKSGCVDGSAPSTSAPLAIDTSSGISIFGTTQTGGKYGKGVIYEYTR